MKTCSKCKESKELSLFSPDRRNEDGKQDKCKKCKSKAACEWAKTPKGRQYRKEQYQINGKNSHLKYKYGITLEQKQKMFNEQNGKCFTCPYKFKSLTNANVDHNHETGKVRKLLCRYCNTAIGYLKENFETTLNIAKYLHDDQNIV